MFVPGSLVLALSAAVPADPPAPLWRGSAYHLHDLGVADVNRDGHADVFTTNCYGLPLLLVGDGRGGFRSRGEELGLHHVAGLPGIEARPGPGPAPRPGLNVTWEYPSPTSPQVPALVLRFVGEGSQEGVIELPTRVTCATEGEVQVEVDRQPLGTDLEHSRVKYAARSGVLRLTPQFVAVPVRFEVSGAQAAGGIHLGHSQRPAPGESFELALSDWHGMAWSDHDGDGQQDVFVVRGGLRGTMPQLPHEFRDQLLRFDGERFRHGPAPADFAKHARRGRQVGWIDHDADGLLDLYLLNKNGANQLYRQVEPRRFELLPQAGAKNLGDSVFAWLGVPGGDRPGLFVAGTTSCAWFRPGPRGLQRRPLGEQRRDLVRNLAVADFDGDGALDVFVARRRHSLLFRGGAKGPRAAELEALGLPPSCLAAQWCDVDNDGDQDLFTIPGGLFRQGPDGRFRAQGELRRDGQEWLDARCAWFDADGDGILDVVTALLPPESRTWELYIERGPPAGGHWLALDLVGTVHNRDAIGARVEVTSGGRKQVAEVGYGGAVRRSQGWYRLHFGVGEATRVERVEVRWPEGHRQVFTDLAADRRHVLRRSGGEEEGEEGAR